VTAPHNAHANDFQVAVVGFGPTGVVATSLLGAAGLRTLAIDKQEGVYEKPRAIAIDHEILRIFDNLGVAGRVLPYVAPFPASQHFGAKGQLIRRIDMVPEPYPLGYTPTMVFTQPPVEVVLREHAASYPDVVVELGTELLRLEQNDSGVTLHLQNGAGETRRVTADYVIACDGASSGVREKLNIKLDDLIFDEPWLVVDVLVNSGALAKLPDTAAQYCDPARPTSYIIGPGNHRRWEIMLLPGEDARRMEQPDQVWALLARWLSPDQATLWRAASYRFHALVADDWRQRRVFLAGDAAHQQPPFIGQGMCQGIRDAANLVWKLVRVINGRSSDRLLDSYGEERAEHVRQLTSRIKAIGHVICERDPDAAQARDERILAEGGGKPKTFTRQEIVPPLQRGLLAQGHPASGTLFPQPWVQPWVMAEKGPVLLDEIAGQGWRLVLDGSANVELTERIRSMADALGIHILTVTSNGNKPVSQAAGLTTFTERDGVMQRWFEANKCSAVLVRPDHYVFGVGTDEKNLFALLTNLEERLR
jgi:3-(3-hydroxy-phenyl)propionate hydroxylase